MGKKTYAPGQIIGKLRDKLTNTEVFTRSLETKIPIENRSKQ